MNLPSDFEIIKDVNYVWKRGDIFGWVHKTSGKYAWNSVVQGLAGATIASENVNRIYNLPFPSTFYSWAIAAKITKPRFETKHPYPYGY